MRPPWLPFAGVHAAILAGVGASDFFNKPQTTLEAFKRVNLAYLPDALPLHFNLQMEAGALGAALRYSDAAAPTVIGHPFAESWNALKNLPENYARNERIENSINALRLVREHFCGRLGLMGLAAGPITLAYHLRGKALMGDIKEHSPFFFELLEKCVKLQTWLALEYAVSGADLVALAEPFACLFSQEDFSEILKPALDKIFEKLKLANSFSSLLVCGDVSHLLDLLIAIPCNNICACNKVSLPILRDKALAANKSFGGGLDPIKTLLCGDENLVETETKKSLIEGGNRGFILTTGCDLNPHTPIENLVKVGQVVRGLI